MEGYVMGSKRLTPTVVGKIASKRFVVLLLLFTAIYMNSKSGNKFRK